MTRRPVMLPEGEEKARVVRDLFDRISPRYDLVNRIMTFGMDVGWRRATVGSLGLPGRSLVLDLACGTGDLGRELDRRGYRVVGFDFSHGMLVRTGGALAVVEADVLRMPVADRAADGVTCGFALRNVVSLETLFAELARVVRPGGRIALLETSEPRSRLLRAGHAAYVRTVVPAIGGLLSDRAAYRYLPASTAYLPAAEAIIGLLAGAGFPDAARRQLSGGVVQLLTGTRG